MDWKQLLVYITGSVEEELLLRIEYLVAENCILRDQIKGRVQLNDAERRTLAEIGKKLSKQALGEIATIVKPDTILVWHRKLVAQKFDGFQQRKSPGRPRVDPELEELVLMKHIARNETMETWGFLKPGYYLIHDRDGKYCPAFQDIIDASGINRVVLPPRSPNLNAFAERWVKSVKPEVFSKLILLGERSLRHALTQYTVHFHEERPHQGIGNVIPFPAIQLANDREGVIQCQERLGGLLKYDEREAA